MNEIYNILGITEAILIVMFSLLSAKYSLLTIILSKKALGAYNKPNHVLGIGVNILWVVLFSYIVINAFMGNQIIDNTSFGAIYFRPIILLSATSGFISRRLKYYSVVRQIETLIKMKEVDG